MRNHLAADQVWDHMALDRTACAEAVEHSFAARSFRKLLFSCHELGAGERLVMAWRRRLPALYLITMSYTAPVRHPL
jgi:hypothetical protein